MKLLGVGYVLWTTLGIQWSTQFSRADSWDILDVDSTRYIPGCPKHYLSKGPRIIEYQRYRRPEMFDLIRLPHPTLSTFETLNSTSLARPRNTIEIVEGIGKANKDSFSTGPAD